MDVKQFHRRVLCIALLLSLCLTAMGATLYDLQINQGEALYERSQNKIAETQIVEADRGDILDRNGRVLVSNRVVYQVTLDLDHMGKEPEERNATPSVPHPRGSGLWGRMERHPAHLRR